MQELGVFAKHWAPGKVKTRLAARIGDRAAAALHRRFLEATLTRCEPLADRRLVVFTPHDKRAEFHSLADPAWELMPQTDGDLGERMHAFFAQRFGAGGGAVVVLGADSPSLPVDFVRDAFERLKHEQVVIGPSEDGGYYLLGAAVETPKVFDGIPWGTAAVLEATVEKLRRQSVRWSLLPPWYDVDEWRDLNRLRGELIGAAAGDLELRRLQEEIEKVLSCTTA